MSESELKKSKKKTLTKTTNCTSGSNNGVQIHTICNCYKFVFHLKQSNSLFYQLIGLYQFNKDKVNYILKQTKMKQLLFSFYILYIPYVSCTTFPFGFSYTRFSGPVSGPEKQIIVYDAHQHGYPHVDYIAKPDYQFSYGIDDPKTKVQQSRKEIRNGDLVQGEYR